MATLPGSTEKFHNLETADPDVVEHDEATKDQFPLVEFSGFLPELTNETTKINVPVLSLMGDKDFQCAPNALNVPFSCATGADIARREVPTYGPDARVTGCSVHGSGHSVSLARNNELQVRAVAAWIRTMIGGSPTPMPAGCES